MQLIFLKNQQGNWVSGREAIGMCFEEFFTTLFTSSNPSIPNNLDNLILPSLSQEDKEMLSGLPSVDEIKNVVFSLGSNKAPGPDGILAHFFKFYWNIIGGDKIPLLFRQCHCHIPLFFFFPIRNDMCTQFLQYFYNKF